MKNLLKKFEDCHLEENWKFFCQWGFNICVIAAGISIIYHVMS